MAIRGDIKGVLPPEFSSSVNDRFYVIGDIAVVSLSPDREAFKECIAGAIISRRKSVKTVLNKRSKTAGNNRVAEFELITGSCTETEHREFGFRYLLDVTKVFFNPSLGSERHRVTALVHEGEHVLIPFCGAGPFVIPVAAAGSFVTAIESNNEACRYLRHNAGLNRVEHRVTLHQGDARAILGTLGTDFDRAVVPAPYGMDDILDPVKSCVKDGGMIHFYTFKKKEQIGPLCEKYEKQGLHIQRVHKCGNIAPGVNRWAFDLMKHG
jgi:tRNA (guanine37-N1)-methyltransferase